MFGIPMFPVFKCSVFGDPTVVNNVPNQSCFFLFYSIVRKDEFKENKNDLLELEPFVKCGDCGRKLHQVCVLHNENIWRNG